MWVAFANAKVTHIFSTKMLAYDQSFNDTLTNDIASFEQLGPVYFKDVSTLEYFNIPRMI